MEMELTVYVEGLSEEFQEKWNKGQLPLRTVRFHMFKAHVQQAIRLAGYAVFKAYNLYERINVPD